jgi:GNAT superfamily N-acetyltransferase
VLEWNPEGRETESCQGDLMSPANSEVEIRIATIHDVARIAAALGRAFHDDPVFSWMIPDSDRRRAVLPGFFTIFTAAFQRHGHVYRTADGAGAALWVPPGVAPVDDDEAEAFGAALAEICGPDAERSMVVGALLDENHPHEPVWYLNFMGVEPANQGRGVGSALLERILVRADRDAATAYLDATSMRNRRLYERHGFEAGDELLVPGGPPLWPMWRQPRSG